MRRKFNTSAIVLLVMCLASVYANAAPNMQEVSLANPVYSAKWVVEYQERVYNSTENTTTFSYLVTVKGDPALSHFTVGLPLCDKEQAVVSYSPDYAVSIGLDPTSGVSGIKWDIGLKPGESRLYSFTLKGDIAAGPAASLS